MTEPTPEIKAAETATGPFATETPSSGPFAQPGAPNEPGVKPTETVDFWKQKAREQEKRAKENAQKASDYDAYVESQKTESQKQADALAKAQQDAAAAVTDSLRYKAAATHQVAPEFFDMLGVGTEEEITGRAERLGGLLAAQKELESVKAELEALKKGKPQSAPVANLHPGATPEQVVADDFAYPASWIQHQK